MPYISKRNKVRFEGALAELQSVIARDCVTDGELNYLFTRLSLMYVGSHGLSYATISDVVKSLECAKLEFYRRVAAPYEDAKIAVNGDVY
jgi:hypothetical protein